MRTREIPLTDAERRTQTWILAAAGIAPRTAEEAWALYRQHDAGLRTFYAFKSHLLMLEKRGYVQSTMIHSGKRRRRLYFRSEDGTRKLAENLKRMEVPELADWATAVR